MSPLRLLDMRPNPWLSLACFAGRELGTQIKEAILFSPTYFIPAVCFLSLDHQWRLAVTIQSCYPYSYFSSIALNASVFHLWVHFPHQCDLPIHHQWKFNNWTITCAPPTTIEGVLTASREVNDSLPKLHRITCFLRPLHFHCWKKQFESSRPKSNKSWDNVWSVRR